MYVFSGLRSLQYWSSPVCVYVCCAALSPSFYFCLHCPSFVCSTPSLWVSNWLSSQYYFSSFCVSVWMFVLLHESKRREGREERTTQQIQTNTTATSHSAQLPHQTNYWIFNSEQEKTEVWVNAILIIKNSFIEVILFRSMWLWKVLLSSITFILVKWSSLGIFG